MNLKEYFKNQKCKLSDEEKLIIFDKINTEITRNSIFSKISFYVKTTVYSVILIFIFSGIFLPTINYKASKNVEITLSNTDKVSAQIGRILESTGKIQIFDNNVQIDNNLIRNGSLLKLEDNSYAKVLINSGINLYLVGPASVKVNKDENTDKYYLNIIDGDYINIKSNSNNDKLVIKSKYVKLEPKDKLVDIKYEEKKGISIIKNQGGDVIVKTAKEKLNLSQEQSIVETSKGISSIFSQNVDYKVDNQNVKKVLSSSEIRKVGENIDRKDIMVAVGEYVLGKLNQNKELEKEGKYKILRILLNTYTILNIDVDKDIQGNLYQNNVTDSMLEKLSRKLIIEMDKKYVLPNIYLKRIKIILAYVLISDKIKKGNYKNLSDVVNTLNISKNYKKILLTF